MIELISSMHIGYSHDSVCGHVTSATQKKLTVASCCTCSSSGLDAHTPTETCSLFLLPPPLLTSSYSNSSVRGPIRPLPVVSPGQCSNLPLIPRRGLQHQWGGESQGEGKGVWQWMLHELDGGWGKVHCGRASYLTVLTQVVTLLIQMVTVLTWVVTVLLVLVGRPLQSTALGPTVIVDIPQTSCIYQLVFTVDLIPRLLVGSYSSLPPHLHMVRDVTYCQLQLKQATHGKIKALKIVS